MSKKRVRNAILKWFGLDTATVYSDLFAALSNNASSAGQSVNTGTVMQLSAAWACSRLISESIATLPIRLYERREGKPRVVENHPLSPILHRSPNASTTKVTFWESSVAAMLLRGNSLSQKQYVGNRLVGLRFLAPHRIGGYKNQNGVPAVMYTERDGTQTPIPWGDIFHVPGFSLDGLWGLSTIQYGAGVFGNALAATTAANKTFENGLMPTTALKFDHDVKKEQREQARANAKEISGALHAGETPVLQKGQTIEPVGINPADAQLLESRQYSVEEVCRWFRVDPSLVGHGNKDSNWGTGLEQKLISFMTFTLRPWVTRIEEAINQHLVPVRDRGRLYAEFSLEGLLRADSSARANFYSVMVNNGIFTRDEVRVLENREPRGGNADVLTVQTALAPLDDIGQQNQSEQARNALKAWLNEQENGSGGDDG